MLDYVIKDNGMGQKKYTAKRLGDMERVMSSISFLYINDVLEQIEFYSIREGIAKYLVQDKALKGNTWEEEEVVQTQSTVSYHYTGFLLNGVANQSALDKIIANTSNTLDDKTIVGICEKVMRGEDPQGIRKELDDLFLLDF